MNTNPVLEPCPITYSKSSGEPWCMERRKSKVISSLGKDWFSILWAEIIWDIETHIFNLCKDENSNNTVPLAFPLVIQPIRSIQAKALLNRWAMSWRLEENIIMIQLKAKLVKKQVSEVPLCVENFLPWERLSLKPTGILGTQQLILPNQSYGDM